MHVSCRGMATSMSNMTTSHMPMLKLSYISLPRMWRMNLDMAVQGSYQSIGILGAFKGNKKDSSSFRGYIFERLRSCYYALK